MSSTKNQQNAGEPKSEFFIPASYNKPVIRPQTNTASLNQAKPNAQPKMANLLSPRMEMGHVSFSPMYSGQSKPTTPRKNFAGIDPSHYSANSQDLDKKASSPLKPKMAKQMPPQNWNVENNDEREKKRKIFRRPKENSKLEKCISCLEDKRIKDDDLEQLEDLQMPRLRKVLNIIFVTLGVFFLLSVMSIIVYTSFSTEDNFFSDLCVHKKNASRHPTTTTTPAAAALSALQQAKVNQTQTEVPQQRVSEKPYGDGIFGSISFL